MSKAIPCPPCYGRGWNYTHASKKKRTCEYCKGKGTL